MVSRELSSLLSRVGTEPSISFVEDVKVSFTEPVKVDFVPPVKEVSVKSGGQVSIFDAAIESPKPVVEIPQEEITPEPETPPVAIEARIITCKVCKKEIALMQVSSPGVPYNIRCIDCNRDITVYGYIPYANVEFPFRPSRLEVDKEVFFESNLKYLRSHKTMKAVFQ